MSTTVVKHGRGCAHTAGLAALGYPEVRVSFADDHLLPEADTFLRFAANFFQEQKGPIADGETMAYGYWIVKFIADAGFLDVWEYNADASEYVAGATLALTYWRDQHRICGAHQSAFSPPRPDRLAVVDEGVFAGLAVEGVRYPSPDHMSGWWITTEKYNGDVSSLRREHVYHLTARRPEIARYIALTDGFRFWVGNGNPRIIYDESVVGVSNG